MTHYSTDSKDQHRKDIDPLPNKSDTYPSPKYKKCIVEADLCSINYSKAKWDNLHNCHSPQCKAIRILGKYCRCCIDCNEKL